MRNLLRLIAALLILGGATALYAFAEARRDPVVRRATIHLPRWPSGAPPVRAVLISDIHIGNATTDAHRLDRIVTRIDALNPDIILIAGDFIAGEGKLRAQRNAPAMVAPLSRLRAPLGVVAVLGNHDWGTDAATVRVALERAHVTLLENSAIQRGPLAIGGIGDGATHHDKPQQTIAAMRALPGAPVVMTHSPDIPTPKLAGAPMLLAGHTHCGQIVLPVVGAIAPLTPLLRQRLCGVIREPNLSIIVTGGTGTSDAPLRLNAQPEFWLLTLGP